VTMMGDRPLPPIDPDDAVEAAVLASLLEEHPAQLTALDLYRERRYPDDLQERDSVDRAVQDLVSAGLVHRSGPFVVPSRAALRFEDLASL
jgi:hypothetical protein